MNSTNIQFKVFDDKDQATLESDLNNLVSTGVNILSVYPYNNGVIVAYLNLKGGNNENSANTQK